MFFFLKALLRNLFLPPTGPLLMVAAGAALMHRRRRAGSVLVGAGLAALWLLSTPLVADALLRLTERYPALDLSKPTGAGAIVILGGGTQRMSAPEYGGAMVDDELLDRVVYGAFVARRTGLPVLVSGTALEAQAMRATLARNFGIDTAWVEGESRDTFENARFTAKILAPARIRRIVLVTSSQHMWRAAQEFIGAGFEVVPAPANVWVPRDPGIYRLLPGARPLGRSRAALYEFLGESVRKVLVTLRLRRFFYPPSPTTTSLIRMTGEMSV